MDCWPCSTVRSIPDLSGGNISSSFNIGMPYTKTEKGTAVELGNLLEVYEKNKDTFDADAKGVSSNNLLYRYE